MKKFSIEFERDFNWYLSMRNTYNFDGVSDYFKRVVQVYKRKVGDKKYQLQNEMPFSTFKESFPNCTSSFIRGSFFEYYISATAYPVIIFDKNGVSGKEAFYQFDSNGLIMPTKHPNILHAILKTKGSANLHIKMYAEDRANGALPLINFEKICKEYKCPDWFRASVEQQKVKYY